jgi:hypothetical protein
MLTALSRLATTGLLLGALAGVARAEPPYRLVDSTAIEMPTPGRAALYLTREQLARATPLKPEALFLDGVPLGYLPQRSFLGSDSLAPGQHCLAGLAGMPEFCMRVRAGERVLLRLREIVDADDHLAMEWLRDDPDRIESLARDGPLRRAITTPQGMRVLARHTAHRVTSAEPALASAPLPITLDEAWLEIATESEDGSSLRHRASWRLVVDSISVHAISNRYALDVPISGIRRVHFGGVRQGSPNPWIEIEYGNDGETRIVAFADSRPESATRSYNAIFGALRELRLARAIESAAPDSAGAPR